VEVVVPVVDGRRNRAHGPVAAPGDEVIGVNVVEDRVALAVEGEAALRHQRRHPQRVVGVERPGERDERFEVGVADNSAYRDRGLAHGAVAFCTGYSPTHGVHYTGIPTQAFCSKMRRRPSSVSSGAMWSMAGVCSAKSGARPPVAITFAWGSPI